MQQPDHFTLLTEHGAIVPRVGIFINNGFLEDPYVIVEKGQYQVKIIDAQNWGQQKYNLVVYKAGVKYKFPSGNVSTIEGDSIYDVATSSNRIVNERDNKLATRDRMLLTSVDSQRIEVFGVMGTLYIFVIDTDEQRVMVYRRAKGTLEAILIDSRVQLREISHSSMDELNLRREYGDKTFRDTDLIVKQTIAKQLLQQNVGTIRYCQTNRGARVACQQLPPEDKIKLCFSRQGGYARECDKIPAFTKEEFQRWVPTQIEAREDSYLLFEHEYYPQNYKLAIEGFSEAMYKAYLLNTICAILRVPMFIKYPDRMPPLPPYIDQTLIANAIRDYQIAIAQNVGSEYYYTKDLNIFGIKLQFSTRQGIYCMIFVVYRYKGLVRDDFQHWVTYGHFGGPNHRTISPLIIEEFKRDKFIGAEKSFVSMVDRRTVDFSFGGKNASFLPNVLVISRMIKILFDNGFSYAVKINVGRLTYDGDIIPIN